jgi:uncharacterized metal-binding protein
LRAFLLGVIVDLNTLIALLTLIVVVVGAVVGVLWSRLNDLGNALVDERVNVAKQYITSVEMDRRLEQAIKPVEKMLEKIEEQNKQIFAAITHGKRMSDG